MQILSNQEIHTQLRRLMEKYPIYKWAVAWASPSQNDLEYLFNYSDRIRKLIIGMHFYQTHPDFIERFQNNHNVKYVMCPSGVYHPKVYLFEDLTGRWECIVGSPNFTRSAFANNKETAVLISHSDNGADLAYNSLCKVIENCWDIGRCLNLDEIKLYRNVWESKKRTIEKLTGQYDPEVKKKRPLLDSRTFSLTWREYYNKVMENDFHDIGARLAVINYAHLALQNNSLKDCLMEERQKIAGTIGIRQDIDWGFFGSMRGAGVFQNRINNNNVDISNALDKIPMVGEIKENNYNDFIENFIRAFPDGGEGLATATRLLAMKRPDYFVCLDSKNKNSLCADFGIPQNVTKENYWNRVVEQIIDSLWWNSDQPNNEAELQIWKYRAAFLDSIYYNP